MIMNTVNKILEKVNHYIDALPYERKPESLYEPIRYVLSIGGKRIRPVLMLLSYNLYRDDVDKILSVACGLETYHNYTLLHDDLMDQAPMRRGMPTVHRKWDANTAILSGDSMLVLAFQRIADCDDKHLRDIVKLFTETALEIGEGQQFDMDFEQRTDVSEEEYINMIRLKTSVLLACATKMGACLADLALRLMQICSIALAKSWDWLSSCRTISSMFMATLLYLARPLVAILHRTKRHICS